MTRNDGSGRFVGGSWVTDEISDFTLGAEGGQREGHTWLPCTGRGSCTGTYREVYEGSDARSHPVQLILEFQGGELRW